MENDQLFLDVYIERCDKESENLISEEETVFFNQSISYFKKNINEFIYIESPLLETIGVDAISFEVDDVFRTYDVMLGLKLQKKFEAAIKSHFDTVLSGDETSVDLMFNQSDGLWDINFTLNDAEGFNEEMTVGEAFSLIYTLISELVEQVKESK